MLQKVKGSNGKCAKNSLADIGKVIDNLMNDYYGHHFLCDPRYKNINPVGIIKEYEMQRSKIAETMEERGKSNKTTLILLGMN